MDNRSASSSTGLEWENLAVYNAKHPGDHQIHSQFGMNELGCADQSSCIEGFGKVHHPYSKNSYDPIIGLRLETQREYGHHTSFLLPSTKTDLPVSSMPAKRSRASYQNMQNPCCQVEGCNLDLKSAKDYHRRHRICENHSKSPKVIVAGNERRFCQQCSRFHDLSEFDDKKRSCRRRLSDHNARRRRVQPDSMQLTSTGLISPALYDQRKQNVLLSGLPISLTNQTWENVSNCMSRSHDHNNNNNNNIHSSISNLHMESERFPTIHNSNHRGLDQCLQVASTSNSSIAPDLASAHSLLSSNVVWSYNQGEPCTSMDGLVSCFRHSEPAMSNHMSLFQSGHVPMAHSGDLSNGGSSHHQEYQLFKAPYDSGGYYSSQRYL